MYKIGDRVARISYGKDVCFRIVDIDTEGRTATLKGCEVRLLADGPLDDLAEVTETQWQSYVAQFIRKEHESIRLTRVRRALEQEKHTLRAAGKWRGHEEIEFFERPGTILHVDGDDRYLEKCLSLYKDLRLQAHGYHVSESKMPDVIVKLLESYQPDILIVTGHDGLLKKGQNFADVRNYRNTEYFIRAVRMARQFERSYDDLVIFAGACQSHYEAILGAGANFASSPGRILIHALDPVFLAEKIAFTPINQTINIFDVVKGTITGTDGLGGIESRGRYRIGIPRSSYWREK